MTSWGSPRSSGTDCPTALATDPKDDKSTSSSGNGSARKCGFVGDGGLEEDTRAPSEALEGERCHTSHSRMGRYRVRHGGTLTPSGRPGRSHGFRNLVEKGGTLTAEELIVALFPHVFPHAFGLSSTRRRDDGRFHAVMRSHSALYTLLVSRQTGQDQRPQSSQSGQSPSLHKAHHDRSRSDQFVSRSWHDRGPQTTQRTVYPRTGQEKQGCLRTNAR